MIPVTKVFVGNLPSGSKPGELRRLFETYGVVTECDIMNRCGFVHMETEAMAESAIKELNNVPFKGSMISVEPGRMKERNKVHNTTINRKNTESRLYDRKAHHDKGNDKRLATNSFQNARKLTKNDKKSKNNETLSSRSIPKSTSNFREGRTIPRNSTHRRLYDRKRDFRSTSHSGFFTKRVSHRDQIIAGRISQNRDRRGFTLSEKQIFAHTRDDHPHRFTRANSSGSIALHGNDAIYGGTMQTSGYSDSSSNHTM